MNERAANSITDAQPQRRGPFVGIATFIERALRGDDGVYTLVRVVDTMSVNVVRLTSPASPMPKGLRRASSPGLTLFLLLRRGDYLGKGELAIDGVSPKGVTTPFHKSEIDFSESTGINLLFETELRPEESGTYWFDINFNGVPLTRVPLLVSVNVVQAEETTKGQRPAD